MIDCAEYYEFIEAHAEERVEDLALRLNAFSPEARTFILRQIEGRQRLRTKVPSWCAVPRLHFPPRLSLEQCSGEVTARYKATLVEHWVEKLDHPVLVDLTGGMGIDFSFMAAHCAEAVYVERNAELVELAAHNFPLIGLTQARTVCSEASTYLDTLSFADILFLDPARRDEIGRKVVRIEACDPDVCALSESLRSRCRHLLIKLSPMLDVRDALDR
ncbi:MAG: SAM-dependent methyltransferase, partial [Prevotellaceae bacterium]|nr:SAM-dependent methyltransferase [Prevotellaceae bacterium]